MNLLEAAMHKIHVKFTFRLLTGKFCKVTRVSILK